MTTTPLPCPFCGHVGLEFREGSSFRWLLAECGSCGASCGETRIQTTGNGNPLEWADAAKTDAVKQWNERAPATAPDDQLRKYVELLLTNANWNVGGVLSEESRRRDYPSNGVAHVRLRDLARLRDALKGTP